MSVLKSHWQIMSRKTVYSYFSYSGLLIFFFLSACSNNQIPPKDSMRLTTERLAHQAMQSRNFDVTDPSILLRSIMNIVQDQHYTIREVNAKFGTVYADQTYDIGKPLSFFGIPLAHFHQKTWANSNLNIQFGPLGFGGGQNNIYLAKKNSSLSAVIMPLQDQKGYEVRISIEVRNFYNNGQVGEIWLIKDPKVYQRFFASLSQALYLQANH